MAILKMASNVWRGIDEVREERLRRRRELNRLRKLQICADGFIISIFTGHLQEVNNP